MVPSQECMKPTGYTTSLLSAVTVDSDMVWVRSCAQLVLKYLHISSLRYVSYMISCNAPTLNSMLSSRQPPP